MRLREQVAQLLVKRGQLGVAAPLAAAGLRVSRGTTGRRLDLRDGLFDGLARELIDSHFGQRRL